MAMNSKSGGANGLVTASTALLNQRLGTSLTPRMLTPSEIELLRQSKHEIAHHLRKKLHIKSRPDPATS